MTGAKLASAQKRCSPNQIDPRGCLTGRPNPLPAAQYGSAGRESPEEFENEMEANELIDSIEQDIQRMRIDDALKASLVAKLDALRTLTK
jgi:hypothetical protein